MSDNKVTIDQLDNSAVEAMSSSVGDVSMLNTENKTIVGALAEIVGKKEIANAIGEPLVETDKFTEMSSEINGLLSTFKTNMMNAGVVVESGDKFKALIDKIKGLTEGEGNKGIQYAEGNVMSSGTLENFSGWGTTYQRRYRIEVNGLSFKPNIVLINFVNDSRQNAIADSYSNSITVNNISSSGSESTYWYTMNLDVEYNENDAVVVVPGMKDDGFILFTELPSTEITYHAFGVGEEDTTLRDSLASILEEKGVDVTEEDDMASLINKVDNMSGGINIITASELPAVGIENQLCVINENPINDFIITSDTSLLDSNKTILYTTPNIPTNYTYTSELLTYELGIYKAKSGNNASATYCWKGSSWELICNAYYGILTNGKDTGSGTFSDYSNKLYHDTSKGVYRIGVDNAYTQFVSYNELIDFGIYTKVEVDAYLYSSITTYLTIGKSSMMYTAQYNNYNESTACNGGFTSQSISSTTLTTMTFDITSISGTGYLTIFKPTGGDAIEIKNIRLYY